MAEPQQQDPSQGKGNNGLSASQLLALAILGPLGATLLVLAGVTLTGTVIGIAVTTPLFVIFSPVLLPAAFFIGLAVAGFVMSGAFGVTSLSSFGWMANYLRRSRLLEPLQHAKRRAVETVYHVAQRAKEAVEGVIKEAEEAAQKAQNGEQETGQTVQNEAPEEGEAQEQKQTSS